MHIFHHSQWKQQLNTNINDRQFGNYHVNTSWDNSIINGKFCTEILSYNTPYCGIVNKDLTINDKITHSDGEHFFLLFNKHNENTIMIYAVYLHEIIFRPPSHYKGRIMNRGIVDTNKRLYLNKNNDMNQINIDYFINLSRDALLNVENFSSSIENALTEAENILTEAENILTEAKRTFIKAENILTEAKYTLTKSIFEQDLITQNIISMDTCISTIIIHIEFIEVNLQKIRILNNKSIASKDIAYNADNGGNRLAFEIDHEINLYTNLNLTDHEIYNLKKNNSNGKNLNKIQTKFTNLQKNTQIVIDQENVLNQLLNDDKGTQYELSQINLYMNEINVLMNEIRDSMNAILEIKL
jgi:hypothetical protein